MTRNQIENQITFISPLDERWISYIDRKSEATIFHHPAWINLIAGSYNYRPFVVVILDSQGNIDAGIPFVEIKSPLTGKRWVSLSFSDHCAPLFETQSAINSLIQGISKMYLDDLAPNIEMRWDIAQPEEKWSTSSYAFHVVKLEADHKKVFRNFRKMHQRNVKSAIKKGVEVKHETGREALESFYSMHLETRSRLGVPIQPKKFFNLLQENLIEKGLGFISLASVEGESIAGAIFLHYKKNLMYKYGASRASAQHYRPNNLIFGEAIEWGCKNGYTALDLGKTDLENEGLRSYKSGWGAEEINLVYSYLSDAPVENHGGFLKSGMEKFITFSPEWVCRATGELLYRHFG